MAWIVAAALVAGAWAVTAFTPDDDAGADAFTLTASIGEHVGGRNIAVTVLSVRAAHGIESESGWSADGTWVVVDMSAEAVVSQADGLLSTATLRLGERTFSATERGPDEMSLYRTPLVPGVPKSGSVAFEVPDDALAESGVLRLSTSSRPWGDTVIEVPVDLSRVDVAPVIEVADTGWTRP